MTRNSLINQFNTMLAEDDMPQMNGENEALFMFCEDDEETIMEVLKKLVQLQQDFELEYCDDGYVEILVTHLER